MQITIIAVGKLRERHWKDAIAEYYKRLGRYCNITLVEVADEKAPEKLSAAQMLEVLDKEGERLLKNVRDNEICIALAVDGESISSEQFAQRLENFALNGYRSIAFIIGGSLGLSDKVLFRADNKLSFSLFTFPHQLMRVILLEQIYRAYKIIQGETYHK